jgi:hypothetical protein
MKPNGFEKVIQFPSDVSEAPLVTLVLIVVIVTRQEIK